MTGVTTGASIPEPEGALGKIEGTNEFRHPHMSPHNEVRDA